MENSPWEALFFSDIGLLSLFTIGFVLVMAVYIFLFVRRNVMNAVDPDTIQQKDQHTPQHS
ncbi:DUF3149 domain-containing protein [Silvimonas iriomotensis]|uniref:DUF3149 domain-containing protein n=1 Tax=Silvimonas iriomotensis TaxID=449662 RepID=A0ABQ2P4Z8_9NEIS|nr:DUF3149 domain-containing protein [Silvimonas iriomotensis]GGP18279.1 hypothetical protein GCM10010970_04100 [Silvimonas iriomotensis]